MSENVSPAVILMLSQHLSQRVTNGNKLYIEKTKDTLRFKLVEKMSKINYFTTVIGAS